MDIWEGIDISQFNGQIQFSRVKEAGKTFVMVRAGWCGYDGSIQVDQRFDENMREAAKAGLDTGVYLYNYAKTPAAARKAAENLLIQIKPYRVNYPVVLDMEDSSLQPLGKEQLTETSCGFLEEIEAGGYYAALYTSAAWMNSFLIPEKLARFDWWIADWRQNVQPQPQWGMWQYAGDQGRVDGVQGPCDLDRAYKNYPAIMLQYGFNKLDKEQEIPPKPEIPSLLEQIENLQREVVQWKKQYEQLAEGLRTLLDRF